MDIISREEWGARPPTNTFNIRSKSGGVVVHYTAKDTRNQTHWPDCYQSWRGHQRYHMDNRGWSDLAYNFGVCPHGFIFEGRGWENRNGANTPENDRTLSVCVDATGDQPLDDAVIANTNALIAEAVEDEGWARQLRGHYQVSTSGTECPGSEIKSLLIGGVLSLPSLETPTDPASLPSGGVPLLGGDVSPLAMQDWARANNSTQLFEALALPARAYSLKYGVNPRVTYAIMAHETAFGRFGGILDESFHNWGGIKTADGGSNSDPNAHQRFNDNLLGVLAVIQHVAGYAGLKIPREEIVDPRYHLLAGMQIAAIPSDEWAWASDGLAHSEKVAAYAREMS